jgi:hypothetical protein
MLQKKENVALDECYQFLRAFLTCYFIFNHKICKNKGHAIIKGLTGHDHDSLARTGGLTIAQHRLFSNILLKHIYLAFKNIKTRSTVKPFIFVCPLFLRILQLKIKSQNLKYNVL